MLLHLLHDLPHELLPHAFPERDLFHQVIVDLWLQVFQGKIVQLYLDLGDTKPHGDGRVDIHCLPGLLLLLFRLHVLKGPHIVETVRQLDEDDTDILGHGKEHLSKVLCLDFDLIRIVGQLSQLCNAVDQKSDLRPEFLFDLRIGHPGILHGIVQKTRNDGFLVQLQVRQDNGHTERVDDIGLSGFSFLILVGLLCGKVGLFDHGDICRRVIFSDAFYQLLIKLIRAGKIVHGLNGRICFPDRIQLFLRNASKIFTIFTGVDHICHLFLLPPCLVRMVLPSCV